MNDARFEDGVAAVASSIGEPARARILLHLMDGHAGTATELALVADVAPSTASAHLARLQSAGLVTIMPQGRHRYYRLASEHVPRALERLLVLAGATLPEHVTRTPRELRAARTCYDHMAGSVAVTLHDRFAANHWIVRERGGAADAYAISPAGARAFAALGLDLERARRTRRRFAYACLDWSERRPHLAGALGAALLDVALARRWVERDRDGRALEVTARGRKSLGLA